MTKRSELQQRIAEAKAKVMNSVANRVFTTNDSGLDGITKRMVVGTPREPDFDPELSHSDAIGTATKEGKSS